MMTNYNNNNNVILFITMMTLVVATTTITMTLATSVTPPEYHIGYQVHSWNDLDEWQQMYRKGTQWNKIDLHYMDAEFCRSQDIDNDLGCFVLSHDMPSSTTRYNTSTDVINFISANADAWYSQSAIKKYMALCFKLDVVDVCDNSSTSQNYIALVTQLVDQFVSTISSHNLNLEVILDGSGAPVGACLAGLWQPLVSTWIRSPHEALYSDNPALGYDRFQVMDLPIEPIVPAFYLDLMCLESPPYGKFSADNATYPVLVWEPSTQAIIESVASSYISCQHRHPQRTFSPMRYATNIDPAQLLVYLAGQSSTYSWNARLNSESPSAKKHLGASTNFFKPLVAVATVDRMTYTFAIFTNDTNNYYYHLLASNGEFGQLNEMGIFMLGGHEAMSTLVSVNVIYNQSSGAQLFTYDINGAYMIYSITQDPVQLLPVVSGQLEVETSGQPIISSTINILGAVNNAGSSSYIELVQYYAMPTCHLGVYVWAIDLTQSNSSKTISSPGCLYPNTPSFTVANLTAVSANNSSSSCAYDALVFYSSGDSQEIGGFALCFDQNLFATLVAGPTVLGVGANPQASIVNFQGNDHVMLVNDQGYCFNTETRNKRPYPRVCESQALAVSGSRALNYNYGLLSDYLQHVHQNVAFSPCSEIVLHGAYDQGSFPSIAIFQTVDATGNSTIGVIELHQGVPADFVDTAACGAPTTHADLVIDSWPIYPSLLKAYL
ncbi:hypothetical protein SAMD00019534_000700, partial [Acytostelium subglobosum LB1]|uniref:hypothetical protein n=1 Tax=Acytostelium subglobosum LB1 TaxID=1410327 RepID=UPI000645219A